VKELLVATRNVGKVTEIQGLLDEYGIKVTSLWDYPDMPEIVEDGKTFEENAAKKALIIAKHTGRIVMGEDSGLEVKALNWRPGIYSARYSGEEATDEENNRKLLEELKSVPRLKRQARYRSFIALANPQGVLGVVDGKCAGLIALIPQGNNGFGYDSLFIVPSYNKTFGQLNPAIKAKISHRARALWKFKLKFKEYLSKDALG